MYFCFPDQPIADNNVINVFYMLIKGTKLMVL